MTSPVFLNYVVGDLTLGKPDLVEFLETETVEAAIRAVGEQSEGAIAVWRKKESNLPKIPEKGPGMGRFVGMVNSLDLVAFMARVGDAEVALRAPVSEVVTPNDSLLSEVDPGTRLIDALEMMKQGVRRLLVRKTVPWRGMSKRFSVIFNGRWMKNCESTAGTWSTAMSSFCCLTREDVVRFLLSCLGALAPLPLTSIAEVNAISVDYAHVDPATPAIHVAQNIPPDPCAVAVVETASDGTRKIIGEISAYKLWRSDHVAASWAMAGLSAAQFVTGFEDTATVPAPVPPPLPLFGGTARHRKFSSRRVAGWSFGAAAVTAAAGMYRGRSRPLTCRQSSSLAAVMAQMLSHRATHVWVTEPAADAADAEDDDVLVGVVSYVDILRAVTRGYADE
ncbi:cystathionine beta-synthase (CBS) family protein [Wolffia australiana]